MDRDLRGRIARIESQVKRVVVVDNGSNAQMVRLITGIATDNPRVEVILNEGNSGIATALNQGYQGAEQLGCLWVLTLDDDSGVFDNMLHNLSRIYQEAVVAGAGNSHSRPVAMVGSRFVSPAAVNVSASGIPPIGQKGRTHR